MDQLSEISAQRKVLQPSVPHIYDLVTVGFGNKALALATAIKDHDTSNNVVFLEQNSSFEEGSHDNRDLDTESHDVMQNSFMHDLATLRNPTSQFTFLNYLQAQGRLEDFIELQSEQVREENDGFLRPLKDEFYKYLSWAAGFFGDFVSYGEEVIQVSRISKYGPKSLWRVVSKDETMYRSMIWLIVLGRNQEDSLEDELRPQRHGDDQFTTLAMYSGDLIDSVFNDNRLLLIRAML
ncbi:L-lysine 6-monooxygenase (NADPH-requiring)-domain-containing protein [Xylogone sp. PMI_703]|nr:L-lysine 6-monooxygenase (NADPH-requiring)-domain-containing protein [Xylogone sp. PMI_703]